MTDFITSNRRRGPFHLMLQAPCPAMVPPEEWIAALSSAHATVLRARAAECHAATILPNGLQAVWTLPYTARSFATLLSDLQKAFAGALPATPANVANIDHRSKVSLKGRRIRRHANLGRYVDNCHFAPVRYGWVNHPEQWPHSSLRQQADSEMILA